MATLSLRRLWIIYKREAVKSSLGKRARLNAQLAFYSGARGILKVWAHLMDHGDYEEQHESIRRQGRQIEKIQTRGPGARRH